VHPPTPLHRPLRVGVVGQGPWGQRLAARWAGAPGVDWRGAAAPGLRPLEGLLDEGLDLALVATDPASHAAVAARCLRAGGAVFVEKPPALDLDELAELEAAAGAPGRLIGSSVWLAVPWVRAARAALAARPAGRGARLELWRHNPSAPATGIDELVDLAPHDLLLLHALTGRSADRAQAHRLPGGVRAQLWWRNPVGEDGDNGEDAALHVTIDLSWALPRARGLRLWEGSAPRLWAAESAGGPAEGAERDATGAPAPLALPDGPEPLIAERDAILGALRQADTAALEAAWAQQRRGVATLAALRASLAAGGARLPIPAPPDPPWTTPPQT
jgi:predicted dehydrogenase